MIFQVSMQFQTQLKCFGMIFACFETDTHFSPVGIGTS